MPKKPPVMPMIPGPIQPKGGDMSRPDLQKINKPKTLHGKSSLFSKGGGIESKGKTKGTNIVMKRKA